MALKQNTVIHNQQPLKFMAGSTLAGERAGWDRTDRLNVFTGGGWSQYFGFPPGHLAPTSWVLPIKSGGLDTHLFGIGSLTGTISGGVTSPCAMSGVGDMVGTGTLVVSGSMSTSGLGTLTGNLIAKLEGTANITSSGTLVGTLTAIGYASSNMAGTGTLSVVSYAKGFLSASITPYTELSPQTLATAVINAAIITPIHSDTKKMNSTTVYGTGVEGDKWRGFV